MTIKVTGIKETMQNLNRELKGIQGRSMGGLLAAGLKVQALAQRRVPVEYGVLRASAYTRKSMDGGDSVEIGFSAAYAIYVHENMEQKLRGKPRASGLGVYWGPAGQPKFLESSIIELKDEIVRTVASHAKVKK